MRNLLCIVLVVVLVSCNSFRVEQEVRELERSSLAPSGWAVVTYVWKGNDIVIAWYDDLLTINDSTKIKRRMQADSLIMRLEK